MNARYLTKSLFQLAVECPTKLFYAGKASYLDSAADNSFLAALAQGGYQVGALACAMFPGGVLVDDRDRAQQLDHTRLLLQRDNVTIFEAALEADGLFVRVDILRKTGTSIEIIEVKAKSYDRNDDADFRNARGEVQAKWLPYLRDVAFQCHVARLAYPQFQFRCALMLADKSARASVNGLNQRFPVPRDGRRVVLPQDHPVDAGCSLGAEILIRLPVDEVVAEILNSTLSVGHKELAFADAVQHLAASLQQDRRIAPRPSSHCGSCQFKTQKYPQEGEQRSGFHECWTAAFGWRPADFDGGTVLDLWNFRKKDELMAQGVLEPGSLTLEDLEHDGEPPGRVGMTRKHRQWYQCHADWPGGGDFYFDVDGMRSEMHGWRFPLHFIDFETSAVAIPFKAGARPYETTAFQFSHHVMHRDGRIEHRSQFLEATPGVDPTVPFLRALRQAVGGDSGTVFRWATHENTVLNQLRDRLLEDPGASTDAAELIEFIESITQRDTAAGTVHGHRNMVDLCKLAERFFFHPSTKGSSSLKKVLPALMQCSGVLQGLYGTPRYGSAEMPSLNVREPMCWWMKADGGVADPYMLLPPVFPDMDFAANDVVVDGLDAHLKEGGAAMTAYARLQFEDLRDDQREAIEAALLRYCELDTLAMVMAVQAWRAWVDAADRLAAGAANQDLVTAGCVIGELGKLV